MASDLSLKRPGSDGRAAGQLTGRECYPLNAVGRATAEAFLRKYRGWPAACLRPKRTFRTEGGVGSVVGLYAEAVRVLGEDELDAVARYAVVRAAANYDPAAHGCSEAGYTYIVNGVYLTVQRAVNEARDRKERQAAVWGEQADETTLDGAVGREPDPSAGAEAAEGVALVRRLLRTLTPRERQAVDAHFRRGMNFAQVAAVLGKVTRERARQVVQAAVGKMRMRAKTLQPPGDGKADPPPRRTPCPRRNRPAASR